MPDRIANQTEIIVTQGFPQLGSRCKFLIIEFGPGPQ